MGIKAKDGEVIRDHREEEFDAAHDGIDELVMVLFPRVSWDAVQELARKTGTTPGEVMSIALKLLEEKLTEEARKINGASSG